LTGIREASGGAAGTIDGGFAGEAVSGVAATGGDATAVAEMGIATSAGATTDVVTAGVAGVAGVADVAVVIAGVTTTGPSLVRRPAIT
jgi:hypothetical protein